LRGVPSILYMRGVYPSEDFKMASKYGLKLLVSKDAGLNEYLDNVIRQLRGTHF
jgi:mitotic spindle assembly checkpoint protein MAD2